MSKRTRPIAILLLLAASTPSSSEAQSDSESPRLVVASWLLSPERGVPAMVARSGGYIVLDTAQGPASPPIDRTERQVRQTLSSPELAAALDTRLGTEAELLQCAGLPTEEQLRAFGMIRPCRVEEGVAVVIRIGSPKPTAAGMTVWVGIATPERRSHPGVEDVYTVSSTDRQLLLTPTPAGGWEVAEVLRVFHSH